MILRRDGPLVEAKTSRLSGRSGDAGPLILVAVPPTGPADHLVRFGSGVAESVEGRLLLATVVPLPRISPYAAADGLLAARSERLSRIREGGPNGLPLAHVVLVGHRVANGLAALARQRRVDLVIVGWPRDARLRGGTKASTSTFEIVKRAPCSVCVVERTPTIPPELVLVSARSNRGTSLGLTVAGAMVACAPSPSADVEGPLLTREVEAPEPTCWPGAEPPPASNARMQRIAVYEPMPSANDRMIAERATGLGADVLVADALRAKGVWPLRRIVLRTDLADFFSGPVALVHARGPFPDPADPRGSNHDR